MRQETKKILEAALLGKEIEILDMEGEPQYTGKKGVIQHIDDIGQMHGTWGGCAINMSLDKWKIISAV